MSTATLDPIFQTFPQGGELPSVDLEYDLPTPPSEAERKAAWLAERRTCISGTGLPAILGLSPWRKPIDVWAEIKGLAPEFVPNDAMRAGKRFERAILEEYSDRIGMPLEFADPYQLIRVPDFPLLGATLDARWLTGDRRPVDAKNIRYKDGEWGDEGSEEFPVYHRMQLHAQTMATDTEVADLAVCFTGQDFVRYTLHRDYEVDDLIKEEVESWWKRHIVGDVPPEPDGSESFTNYLKNKFKRATEVTKPATELVHEWAATLRAAKAKLEAAEQEKAEAEQFLKAYMGEASSIPGVCTWKNNKDSEVTDFKAVAVEAFAELTQLVGMEKACAIRDAALASHTTTKPGPRVFRLAK
jgi:putative phage-type endonuclease